MIEAPGAQPPESESQKRVDQHRELVLAYKRTFATEGGKLVLADLFKKYGFDRDGVENDDYTAGSDGIHLGRRDGTKSPIRYILKMRNLDLRPLGTKPKRERAKSGLAPQPPVP